MQLLQYERRRYRAGNLTDPRKAHLNEELPGRLTPPKADCERALWQQRVTELEQFVREHGRYPRYKKAMNSSEKVLAVWLECQRHCLRAGKLERLREAWLNSAAPNWS